MSVLRGLKIDALTDGKYAASQLKDEPNFRLTAHAHCDLNVVIYTPPTDRPHVYEK